MADTTSDQAPSAVLDIVSSAEEAIKETAASTAVESSSKEDQGDTDHDSTSTPWKSDLMLDSLDRLFKLTAAGYAKTEDSNEFLEKVFTELVAIREVMIKLDKSDQIKCAQEIGDRPQFMAVLVPFMAQVYKALSSGYELKCLCDWQFLLVTLTNVSKKLRLKIVKESVHFEMIKQLIDLPRALEHQELLAELVKMAMYVMLTLIQDQELHHYFSNCHYGDVLITYVPSKNFSIGKLAKISLSILSRDLDHNQAARSLCLTSSDIGIILKVLSNKALSEDEEKESWHILSKDGLVLALKGFCSLKSNCAEFIKQGGLSVLSAILDGSDAEEHEATLLLLWQLSHHLGSGTVEDDDALVDKIVDQIRCLSVEEEGSDLCALKVCLPYCLLHTLPKGNKDCLTHVETIYKHQFYEECVRFCQEATENCSQMEYEPSTVNAITLFHGKASYHVFKRNLMGIKNLPVTSPGYSEKRRACFEDAKQAIHLLGVALDSGFIDPEGSQLLDTASMLALSEPSSLKIDQRCLLCRSKKKLARSHICPRAILDDFAKACGTPSSGKAFFVNWPWQSGISGMLKSAGQVTVKLLCSSCESVLSKNESKFLPKFFRRFYDQSNPTRIEIEQDIEYGEWLYQFCVGLIFRGMTFQYSGGRDEYLNEDEVYSVFVKCRESLLSSKSDDDGGPQVSVYVAPTAASDESELSSSLINMAIHHPFHFFFTQNKGMYSHHQVFLHALSYTFQIGMIMTTVNFSLANWTPDASSVISPTEGSFSVPPNHNRRKVFPDALWETLLAEAVQMEKEVMEQPQRMTLLPLDHLLSVPPSSYMKSIFDVASNSEGMGKGSLLQGHPKVVNFIPSAFSISQGSTGKFELPKGHRVLLHLTTQQEEDIVNTAFIAVGEGPGYSLDKPYLIFHHCKPGLQTNYGYFFSPNTFEFSSYLPDRTPKRFLDKDLQSSGLMDKSKEIISLILRTKGFRNYHSLRYWMEAKRPPTVLDIKCKYKSDFKCWYCNESCEICLEPTVLGPTHTDSTGRVLRFCSADCSDVYKQKPEPHSQVFSPDNQESTDSSSNSTSNSSNSSNSTSNSSNSSNSTSNSSNRRVPVGHKEYVHLSSCGEIEDGGGCFVTSMSLCEGDCSESFPSQQYYLNYHLRTPTYQCFHEFFLSDDLQALESVSYSGASGDLFEQDEVDDIKQSAVNALTSVARNSGCSCVSDLLEKIRLYDMMGSNFATFLVGEDKKSGPRQTAPESSSESFAAAKSTQKPTATAEKADGGNVATKDNQEKPVLVATPQQLLAILAQCGGDQAKAVGMIQEMVEQGKTRGESQEQDQPDEDACQVQ